MKMLSAGRYRKGSYTLEAECPFCHKMNDDDFERGGDKAESLCEHFVKLTGGCGAYAFVFKGKVKA